MCSFLSFLDSFWHYSRFSVSNYISHFFPHNSGSEIRPKCTLQSVYRPAQLWALSSAFSLDAGWNLFKTPSALILMAMDNFTNLKQNVVKWSKQGSVLIKYMPWFYLFFYIWFYWTLFLLLLFRLSVTDCSDWTVWLFMSWLLRLDSKAGLRTVESEKRVYLHHQWDYVHRYSEEGIGVPWIPRESLGLVEGNTRSLSSLYSEETETLTLPNPTLWPLSLTLLQVSRGHLYEEI